MQFQMGDRISKQTSGAIVPTKTTALKCGLLVRSYRPAQPKHRIAEECFQIQPLAQAQTVVQLLKRTLEQGDLRPLANVGAIANPQDKALSGYKKGGLWRKKQKGYGFLLCLRNNGCSEKD